MNGRQRRKLFAGAGLISMLLGAFMTVAPAAVGAATGFQGECDPATSTCVIDEPMGEDPATHGTVTYSRSGDELTFTIDLAAADAPMTELQVCVSVATSPDNPYTPTTANTCAGNQADRVIEDDGPFTDPHTFTIDLASEGIAGFTPGADVFFALHINTSSGRTTYVVGGPGEEPCPSDPDVPADSDECDPCPTNPQIPADSDECGEQEEPCPSNPQIPVDSDECDPCPTNPQIPADSDGCGEQEQPCPTNPQIPADDPRCGDGPDETPEPDEASLTIVKDWTAAPADWEVDFAGDLGAFELTDEDDTEVFADIEPGDYVIREAPSDEYDLVDVECTGATTEPVGNNGVRVTVVEEADVTCTFTNAELEVLPTPPVTPTNPPVTPGTPPVQTPPQVAPNQTPRPQVKGDVVTRQLPRTGDESADLAGFGAGMLLLGAGLVIASRFRRDGIAG